MKKTKKIIKISLFLFLLSTAIAQAALVPCGRNVDDPNTNASETDPCTLCHFIVGFHNLINYGLKIMIFVAFTGLVIAAVMYIVSGGSEQLINTAKSFIKHILYGFGIVLAAWLFIFVVMNYLGVKKDLGIGKEGWNTFTCSTESQPGRLFSGSLQNQPEPTSQNPQNQCPYDCCPYNSGYPVKSCRDVINRYCVRDGDGYQCRNCWPAGTRISNTQIAQCCSQRAIPDDRTISPFDIVCGEGSQPEFSCPSMTILECEQKGYTNYWCNYNGKCVQCYPRGRRCQSNVVCCSGICARNQGSISLKKYCQ